ncbi:MAG: carboxypeptidase-like regulatory domain-containing protein, partial [Myxococcota bacterium]|nr:carboxypeptidase-like regulatory domain-containing protein [Myxococcota bacterium]
TAGETAQVTVTLEDTGTIEGIFLEEDEATPVVSAQLSVGTLGFTTTDVEGKFEILGVPLGTYKITGQNPVNGKYAETSATLTQQGETAWVTLLERASGELTGFVYDSDGTTPLPSAFVTVNSSAPYAPSQTVTSDSAGIYSVPAIPAGGVTVTARHPNKDTLTGTASATLPEDYTSYQLDVYLQPLADLTVQVYEADGVTPATQANIDFGINQGYSDTDELGQARFEGLTLKKYTLTVSSLDPAESRNLITVQITLDTAGEQPVLEVTLPGVGEVTGTVFASDGTTPVVDAVIEIDFLGSDFSGESETALTDIDGNYGFDNVPVGPFQVSAQSGALGTSDSGEVTEDGEIVTVDMMLEESGTVVGRLVRADGITPVSAHTVVLTYSTPSGALASSPVLTDDDGNFEKSLLPLFEPITLSSTLDEVGGIALAEAYLTTDGEVFDVGDMVL